MKKLNPTIAVLLLGTLFSCNQKPVKKEATADFRFEEYSITQLQQGYDNGDFTITEVVQAYLDRIGAVDDSGPVLNAVIQTNPDALAIAEQLDVNRKKKYSDFGKMKCSKFGNKSAVFSGTILQ